MLKTCAIALLIMLTPLMAGGERPSAAPVSCSGYWNEVTQTCTIKVDAPPPPGGEPVAPGQPGVVDQGGEVSACMFRGREISCELNGAWWSDDRLCYVKLADPQPPKDDAIWQGHDEGAIYSCTDPIGGFPVRFWSDSQPAGPAAPVDPAALAQTIVTQMELRAFSIGMIPEDRPDVVSVVGLPLWMWVDSPSEQTFGPMTRSASLGGVTVTATAQVSKVLWEMGDGQAVTCWSAGTPFTSGHGGQQSPDCGYTYTRQGTYTVRATSFWSVDWSSTTGVSGSIPLQFESSRIVRIGEIQVVGR